MRTDYTLSAMAFESGDTRHNPGTAMHMRRQDWAALETQADKVAALLRLLANRSRLLILCRLVELGEASPSALADDLSLSASALSQHLTKLREEGVVTSRRDSHVVWYRIADARVEELFATLHRLYCRGTAR